MIFLLSLRSLQRVALRKESVDRNDIRIAAIDSISNVALRKESVDRNPGFAKYAYGRIKSLSARRAWIEIDLSYSDGVVSGVALRKESVDRNGKTALKRGCYTRRSPQGERG